MLNEMSEKDKYSILSLNVESIKQTNDEYNKIKTDFQIQKANQWLLAWRRNRKWTRQGRGLRGTNCDI